MATITSQHHSFDVELAKKYGIEGAILIHHFLHWIKFNKRMGKNIKDGKCWTFQTKKEIEAFIPYMSYQTVRYQIDLLVEKGVLMVGKFNRLPIDKTCWYAFVDEKAFGVDVENSNNVYESGYPPSMAVNRQAIPDTNKEDTIKEKDKKKKAPLAPAITLNEKSQEFEGITDQDIKNWQEAFPAVSVRKELLAARIWALSTPRKNYRKSIDTWMRNVNQSHTTPFKTQNKGTQETDSNDPVANSAQAAAWEKDYQGKGGIHYDVRATSDRVTFIMPNNEGYSVYYDTSKREFIKLCQKAIKRMNLQILIQLE